MYDASQSGESELADILAVIAFSIHAQIQAANRGEHVHSARLLVGVQNAVVSMT